MKKINLIGTIFMCVAFLGALLWGFSSHTAQSLSRLQNIDKLSPSLRGIVHLETSDFGGISLYALESNALPWRIVAAALVLEEKKAKPDQIINQKMLMKILARFGFLVDAVAINKPSAIKRTNFDMPLGFTYGDIAPIGGTKLRVVNLGCAVCHAGTTYDAIGNPQPERAWLGMPNTSINLEAYVQDIFHALKNNIKDKQKLMATTQMLYPRMSWLEVKTLEYLILPMVKNRIQHLGMSKRALPFPNGVPGSTNGVAALKFKLGLSLKENGKGDYGIVSIPDLADRLWRTSLLTDGAYAPPSTKDRQRKTQLSDLDNEHIRSLARITTFFTVPSMGVHPERAKTFVKEAREVFYFLQKVYKPQTFPGQLDLKSAQRGSLTYSENCSSCHGIYEWKKKKPELILFPNWLGRVGTDTLRAEVFNSDLVKRISETVYSNKIIAKSTQKYVAPPLGGLWASAPYLHNGSVPTIYHLLNPDQRPLQFLIGGHALDFERLGVKLTNKGTYPDPYQPFSKPIKFDVRKPGYSNQGHTFGSQLKNTEKRDLIEFLKLL